MTERGRGGEDETTKKRVFIRTICRCDGPPGSKHDPDCPWEQEAYADFVRINRAREETTP